MKTFEEKIAVALFEEMTNNSKCPLRIQEKLEDLVPGSNGVFSDFKVVEAIMTAISHYDRIRDARDFGIEQFNYWNDEGTEIIDYRFDISFIIDTIWGDFQTLLSVVGDKMKRTA